MTPLRTLIVDDERLARQQLRRLLAALPDVEVVGECATAAAAVEAIVAARPALVLLDVQMPVTDGFGVVAAVGAARMPATVFVTAHDEYALRAFEARALDYLLKPVEPARLAEAVGRARERAERGEEGASLHRRLAELVEAAARDRHPEGSSRDARGPRDATYLERLVLKDDGRLRVLRVDEVDWLEAHDNYVRVHAAGAAHLLRGTLGALEARLDPRRFARVHRSTIVNLDRVREIQPWFHGDSILLLADRTRLTVSRTYRDALLRALEASGRGD